ncbi:M23 family metallopeptidase [Microbacterium karelineae]|uniref:M23 family metallopeptidase n=1 Tax=Microbacterium karelineae TaxID=2654283 RepID=UPI0012EA924E|nr:M23 family metallopeptidase [Microbacterium karelineae]
MTVITQWPVGPTPESMEANAIPYPAVDSGGLYGAPRSGGRIHRGYDFAAPSQWNVRAIADGFIYFRPPYIDNGDALYPSGYAAGGVQVWLQHDGFQSRYFHMYEHSPNTVGLPIPETPEERPIYYGGQGQFVKRGDPIGTVSGTNYAGAPYGIHLHLETVPGTPGLSNSGVDPIPFVRERLAVNNPNNPSGENGDDMYLVKDKALGHVYLIGNQFIKHVTSSNAVGNLRQAGVPYMEGNNGFTVTNVGYGMGIPMGSVYRSSDGMIRDALTHDFGSGKVWSAERRLARILGKGSNF